METSSNPRTKDYTYKQGQYSPQERRDATPKVDPQLTVEIAFQELKRVKVYTERMEDATARRVETDRGGPESAENRLKNALVDFERQGNRVKNGSYVDERVSTYSILYTFFSLSFTCLMCHPWVDVAKDRDNYKRCYEYFQEMDRQKSGEQCSSLFRL